MTQEVLDLGQRGARTEQLRCGEMAQPVRVDAAEAGPLRGGGHDMRHAGGTERCQGSEQADEDGATLHAGRAPAKVRRDRRAHVCRQGHALGPVSLAVHDDLSNTPLQVVEAQGRHFGGAQAETDQRGDDRKVAESSKGPAIADGEQALDVVGLEARRQPGQSSASYRRNSRGQ